MPRWEAHARRDYAACWGLAGDCTRILAAGRRCPAGCFTGRVRRCPSPPPARSTSGGRRRRRRTRPAQKNGNGIGNGIGEGAGSGSGRRARARLSRLGENSPIVSTTKNGLKSRAQEEEEEAESGNAHVAAKRTSRARQRTEAWHVSCTRPRSRAPGISLLQKDSSPDRYRSGPAAFCQKKKKKKKKHNLFVFYC